MSELLQVAAALTRAADQNQVSVLATVVRTEGSTYRRIGARLVALPDGSHVGGVSAGCIENDVLLRAERVRAAGAVELMTYDTRSPDDLIWGFGAGCGGLSELLLEPLDPGQALVKAERLRTAAEWRRPGVLVTVIHATGVALSRGDQAILPHATARLTGFDEVVPPFRTMVEATAREMLRALSSAAVHHVWGNQELDLSYQVRFPRVRLCVCGAGPDAAPLVAMARLLGWHVSLIDHRPAMLSPDQWPGLDCTLVRSPADIAIAVERADSDAAVVMNHHYERDLEFLAAWLGSAVPFIGMLGPRQRTQLMLARLSAMDLALDGAEQRIRSPVGLDLGGETAEEIALSIVAEIKASIAGRGGGSLRDVRAPIHDRERRLEAVR
jgi:xanthine dehydrogenase accessory factor